MALPFDQGLAIASDLGANYVWFAQLPDETPIAAMNDTQVDDMAARVDRHGLKLYQICAHHPFHNIRLDELEPDKALDHPDFRRDFEALVRSMQIASRLDVGAVLVYGLSWPGEWAPRHRTWSKSPTWAMRWATQGGIISESDLDGLVEVFVPVVEQAEHYDVDVVLGMRPFHFLNTATHFCRLAERLDSDRIRAMWSPADGVLSGEREVTGTGFERMRPHLHGLHLKDVHVFDGPQGAYEWRPLGEGQVDYPVLVRRLIEHERDVFLGVATHFLPPGGSRVEAMQINCARLLSLIEQAGNEADHKGADTDAP